MNSIEVLRTSKNKKQFFINQNFFEINKTVRAKREKIFYTRCSHYNINKCKATCVVKKKMDNIFYTKLMTITKTIFHH